MKPKILTLLLCSSFALSETGTAQNISFNPFASAPLMLNPAFTGMFDGKLRANALYRREWNSVNVPNVGMAASVDLPVYTAQNSYWAVGGQVFRGQAGDGTLSNFYGLGSVAFHQKLKHNIIVGMGVQLGYSQKSLDLSRLYFNVPVVSGTFFPGPAPVPISLSNTVNTYVINVGASFYQEVSQRFNYTVGLSLNNINQPSDAIERKMSRNIGDDRYGSGVLSAKWQATKRWEVRPSFLYQVSLDRRYVIGGSEFHFDCGSRSANTTLKNTVFYGLWYRSGDVTSFTAGVEIKRFRASLGYDYHLSTLNQSTYGNGGFEVAARYIVPKRR